MNNTTNNSTKKSLAQVIKFVMFSISAGIIQIIAFTLLNEIIKWPYYLSYGIALACSVVWNFTFNRKFTFQSLSNIPKSMILAFCFYIPFAPITIIGGNWLQETVGWNEYLVVGLTMILNFVTEFLWQKFVVFRDSYLRNKEEQLDKNQ